MNTKTTARKDFTLIHPKPRESIPNSKQLPSLRSKSAFKKHLFIFTWDKCKRTVEMRHHRDVHLFEYFERLRTKHSHSNGAFDGRICEHFVRSHTERSSDMRVGAHSTGSTDEKCAQALAFVMTESARRALTKSSITCEHFCANWLSSPL